MSKVQVAKLTGISLSQIHRASVQEVRQAYYRSNMSALVLGMATYKADNYYWRVGTRYYLDNPAFGPVVAIDDLDYNENLGLHIRKI